jgi:hypothetical protein
MSITVSLVKIERWLRAHTRATAATLAPPATLERLDHAAVLPQDRAVDAWTTLNNQ